MLLSYTRSLDIMIWDCCSYDIWGLLLSQWGAASGSHPLVKADCAHLFSTLHPIMSFGSLKSGVEGVLTPWICFVFFFLKR